MPATILLDAARMGEALNVAKQHNSSFESLYLAGESDVLHSVAPFLFTFSESQPLKQFFFEKGWGDSWGVIVNSYATFKELHQHFRKFLLVKTEGGEELYFRFYDPRVLRIFLPTCDAKQLADFFGPVDYFLTEDEDSKLALKFWREGDSLRSQHVTKEEVIKMLTVETKSSDAPDTATITKNTQQQAQELNTNKSIFPGIPKPKKPKWNMLD